MIIIIIIIILTILLFLLLLLLLLLFYCLIPPSIMIYYVVIINLLLLFIVIIVMIIVVILQVDPNTDVCFFVFNRCIATINALLRKYICSAILRLWYECKALWRYDNVRWHLRRCMQKCTHTCHYNSLSTHTHIPLICARNLH